MNIYDRLNIVLEDPDSISSTQPTSACSEPCAVGLARDKSSQYQEAAAELS